MLPSARQPMWDFYEHPRYRYILRHSHDHVLSQFISRDKAAVWNRDVQWARLVEGCLYITRGYAWDGASGPAIDTTSIIRASLVHDVLYQMIAHGALPIDPWKKIADLEFHAIMEEDGVGWLRRNYAYWAVRAFGRARDKYRP